jgi:Protein of unknown function (DUF3592)
VSSAVLHDLGATAFGLLFVVIGAALYGPTSWSAARLLRTGRQVTATVVHARAGGMSRGSAGPGGYAVDRHYPPSVRLAFTLDGRRREMTLRLAEPGAETGYQAGQQLTIYVGGRLRIRIRTDAEANAHGDFERLLGACLVLGGIAWLVAYAVGF